MPDQRPPHTGAAPAAALAGLVLVALALRPQLASIGPLTGRIVDDLGVSHAFVGLLTTIPILCMGLFAPLGPALAGRVGARRAIAIAAGTVALAGLARAVAPGEAAMLALTLPIGVATAMAGPVLAMFVRGSLPDHRVAGTAAYAGGTTLGQAIAAGIVVPLAVVLVGWRASLGVVSAASALGVVAWLSLTAGAAGHASSGAGQVHVRGPQLPVRRPLVWAIGLLFGIQSAVFYGTNAWLPSYYAEQGWDPAAAAALLSVASFAGLAAIIAAPVLARRGVQRRQALTGAALSAVVGIGGVILAPGLAWAWVAVLGAGLGMLFTTVLTLPTDVAADAREAGGASALMLLVGYLLASVAPLALGAVRDVTGSFAVSLWLLLALAASMLPLTWALSPARLRPRAPRTPVPLPGSAGAGSPPA
jgi:MFS transporter, CP family, cyanate transporter